MSTPSFGELFEDSTGSAISSDSTTVFSGWVTAESTLSHFSGNNTVHVDTGSGTADRLIIGAYGAGVYACHMSMSFTGDAGNQIYHGAVHVNSVKQDNIAFERKIGTGGDIGNVNAMGILNLDPTDVVDIRVIGQSTGRTITISHCNLTLFRISTST